MKVLIDADRIQQAVQDLGQTVAQDYEGRPLTILGVLTGSICFLTDLIRTVDTPHRVGLIQASSYQGKTTTAGDLQIETRLLPNIAGRDVLLVDDIFDTGHTLKALLEVLQRKQPASVKSAVLLWKQDRQEVDIEPDYHCFQIPNEFVVGYGLDYDDEYRHLPHVAVLEPEDLA